MKKKNFIVEEEEETEIIIIKNLDTDCTLEFDPKSADNQYTSITLHNSDNLNHMENIKQLEQNMWDAVHNKDLFKIQKILDVKSNLIILLNCASLDNWTTLHHACFQQCVEIVSYLITKGINIEAKTSIKRTALHLAVIKGNKQIVKLLLESNADPNSQDDDLCTPLHYASIYGYQDIVMMIFQYKDKINFRLKNYQNMTAGQCSLDAKIFKYFNDSFKLDDDQYNRTMIGEMIRKTSRADYVQKLLGMTTAIKMKSIESGDQNINKKNNQAKKSKFEKLSNISKIVIQAVESQDTSKVNFKSFQIINILGKGAFGEVFLVRKKGEQHLYAMKVLAKQRIRSQMLTKYVLSQRNILIMMNNPFIVKIFYAFQTKQKLFLILEYCPGGDLQKKVTREKNITQRIVKIYAAELVIALESLHKCEIIFRDLKPANVVLDSEGHAKITDFGLSKQCINSQSFCGSIAYLAPEMLFNKRHGFTLDWYLLGVLIYELLAGMPPFYSQNRDRLFQNIKFMKLNYPKHFSQDCKDLLSKLLQRDPQKRLGANTDAKQIKSHAWFKDINWQDAYDRKLAPPKIKKKDLVEKKIDFNPGDDNQLQEQRFNGWSFFQQR